MRSYPVRINLEDAINREYPTIRLGVNSTLTDEKGCLINPQDINAPDFINDNPKYGQIDKSFIYIPIQLVQTIDNMGLFTNEDFLQADDLINSEPDPYVRLQGLPLENYFTFDEFQVTGFTESQLDSVQSYNQSNPYVVGLNVAELPSSQFDGVIEIKDDSIVYAIGGAINSTGGYIEGTGIEYETFNQLRLVNDPNTGEAKEIPLTTFKYKTKGMRNFNSQLKALIKEEKYLGIVERPRVDNDVLVDRGQINVFERHLKMSEISSVDQLERYGQGFFNVQGI